MNICVAGKNNIASSVLSFIYNHIQVNDLFVVCNKDDNGIHSWQKSLRKTANMLGVKEVFLQDLYDIENLLFLSVEFDRIIKPAFFKSAVLVNIHFSLLPKYKGVYTSVWPLLNDEEYTGVTLHKIDSGIDTGDIIDQDKYLINEYNARDIYMNNMKIGYNLIIKNINKLISGDFTAIKQDCHNSNYYSLSSIDYNNLEINFKNTAYQIKKQVKAFSFFEYQLPKFEDYYISDVIMLNTKSFIKPGTVLKQHDNYVDIATVDYDARLIKNFDKDMFAGVIENDLNKLRMIIGRVKNVNITDKNGWSVLMIAAYKNAYDIASLLIEKGADVNQKNLNGTSILMYAKDGAVNYNDNRLIKLLIDNGADVNSKDVSGKTVIDYVKNQSTNVYNFLMNFSDGKQ